MRAEAGAVKRVLDRLNLSPARLDRNVSAYSGGNQQTGQARLMTLPEDIAAQCVARQGIGMPDRYGPAAPRSVRALLSALAKHRERRFSMIENTDALGVSALAAPIQRAGMPALGVIVIAGPSSRLTSERMQEFGPALLAVADELAATSDASALMKSSNAATRRDITETLARAGEDPAEGGERERHNAVRAAAPH
ncbi:IclR family transcriptional regulator C-terminal domain-containing protein [Variovorax sp. J22G73]|uniref:IclR family transcriptional regulator domain-containing protein n=1 Tax=unclassified Variovorax TaxID=663243 RepID=UPI0025759564|nr:MULTISPECIES: IclR family transcriptional regulator C-terminal domain-containing protein [unclassified Variovorax]MDM0010206.1 IclR family transcriptional regulator C-terminal domain-containing protein [Variovorax sp. J22R203]MDM0103230.1 IclR family transcriptional regulator C-terminal domain-containing protein [Variovorax sp. J22G73]